MLNKSAIRVAVNVVLSRRLPIWRRRGFGTGHDEEALASLSSVFLEKAKYSTRSSQHCRRFISVRGGKKKGNIKLSSVAVVGRLGNRNPVPPQADTGGPCTAELRY